MFNGFKRVKLTVGGSIGKDMTFGRRPRGAGDIVIVLFLAAAKRKEEMFAEY